jgi:hypothetical protein
MNRELAAEGLPVAVQILGVNGAGLESGNTDMCNGRDLPWLQDTADQAVWTSWAPTYRDVVIVNPDNERIDAYNLTAHDLSDSANYDALKAMLRSAAQSSK